MDVGADPAFGEEAFLECWVFCLSDAIFFFFLSAGIVMQAKGRICGKWQQCGHCWRACHCWKACSRGMCGSLFQ